MSAYPGSLSSFGEGPFLPADLQIESLQVDNASLQEEIARQQEEIKSLQAENARLKDKIMMWKRAKDWGREDMVGTVS